MVATFLLASFILNIKKINGSPDHSILNALSISLCLYTLIYQVGGISGACLNPAVGVAESVYQNIIYGERMTFGALPIYMVAPLVGGIVAGLFSKFN